MKVETKEQVIERLATGWPLSVTGLKNMLEMAYDAGLAEHVPQPSPDICEKCGQEVVDGHFSLVCHKDSCIAALVNA